ncbi:MAG TPA: ATP-binding cassette domain-containing protein [Gemmatimonadaceae bacterium]
MPEFAVEIDRVVKRYVGHVAVRELSLRIPTGTVYGLLGPNGAGKTTTIRMLLDIIAPDEGTIRLLGVPNTTPGITDRTGYLPEERGLYRRMQVRRVLRFLAELHGVPRRVADRRIDEWLERLGLRDAERDWGGAKVDELSRGMQQKVQFIGALLHDPDLVILDEPFSGLDPINAQTLLDIVVQLKHAGKTVLFSTHIMDNAERLCDAVCIIARGEKVLDGAVPEVKARHGGRHVSVELASPRDGCVAEVLGDRTLVRRVTDVNRTMEIELAPEGSSRVLLQRLVLGGADIRRFELVQPSLHRIFLDEVGANGAEEGFGVSE